MKKWFSLRGVVREKDISGPKTRESHVEETKVSVHERGHQLSCPLSREYGTELGPPHAFFKGIFLKLQYPGSFISFQFQSTNITADSYPKDRQQGVPTQFSKTLHLSCLSDLFSSLWQPDVSLLFCKMMGWRPYPSFKTLWVFCYLGQLVVKLVHIMLVVYCKTQRYHLFSADGQAREGQARSQGGET